MARILVVDDDEMLIKLLDYMFSSKGHQVSVANTGSKALSMIDAEVPDLMLLDMMLPEMDGMEVLRLLKASDRQFPVILVSAIDDTDVVNQAMKMGAADHCSKPFKASDLYNKVACCLAARESDIKQEIPKTAYLTD